MTPLPDAPSRCFLYRARATTPRHRGRVAAYLVEPLDEAAVVVRIASLGLVGPRFAPRHGARGAFAAIGGWSVSAGGRHERVRLAATPRGRTDAVVVETGVDPVTSRFSGARSTN